ncbi:YrhK family protein [Gordonia sp. DT218]|uniref:YrhK family protein n=1 Tax=unclassified Gordonia (in: high G+C Gram-positive bacteria) TaxID=2657482 RepID=UPI003CEBEC70
MSDDEVTFTIGREELIVRQRWETISIANDVLIAMWFVAGSILFFWESTTFAATWCFLLGSIEFLVRPAIRLARRVHIRRIRPGATGSDSSFDY